MHASSHDILLVTHGPSTRVLGGDRAWAVLCKSVQGHGMQQIRASKSVAKASGKASESCSAVTTGLPHMKITRCPM